MKEFFKDIRNDKTITFAILINIFLIIATILYILFFYRSLPPLVPVFNQLPWGEQRLGQTFTIFVPAGISLLILTVNVFASALIYKRIPLISRMLAGVSLLIAILTFILAIRTVTLII